MLLTSHTLPVARSLRIPSEGEDDTWKWVREGQRCTTAAVLVSDAGMQMTACIYVVILSRVHHLAKKKKKKTLQTVQVCSEPILKGGCWV